MSVVIAAKTSDCWQIIAVDIDPYKIDFSLKNGRNVIRVLIENNLS